MSSTLLGPGLHPEEEIEVQRLGDLAAAPQVLGPF